tara:strand:+ start:126 stop:629 length:504 start_codon:yes stop_codon:yes gene_type:complete
MSLLPNEPITGGKLKTCKVCGVVKPITEFRVERKRCNDGTRNTCKKCCNLHQSIPRKFRKRWIDDGKEIPKYCECCGKRCKGLVDHDYKTLQFRGWLCDWCNRGIGCLGDNEAGVLNALNYLNGKKHEPLYNEYMLPGGQHDPRLDEDDDLSEPTMSNPLIDLLEQS